MGLFTAKDSATNTDKNFELDGDGSNGSPFVPRSRILLGATTEAPAASPSASSGLNGLIRGFWSAFATAISTTNNAIGTITEATATSPSASSGLNGLIRGFWSAFESSLYLESSATDTAISSTLTTLLTVDVRRYETISFELVNGSVALAEFQMQARYHSSASSAWFTKTSVAADYTTNSGQATNNSLTPAIAASGDLNSFPAGTIGWLEINCKRYATVRIRARISSGSSTITARAISKK